VDSTIPRVKRPGNAVHCVTLGRYLLPPSEPVSPYVLPTIPSAYLKTSVDLIVNLSKDPAEAAPRRRTPGVRAQPVFFGQRLLAFS